MYLTASNSDIFFRIYKVYHKNDEYVKCKVLYFYKNSGMIVPWLNPEGRPKNYKLIRNVYDSFIEYKR